LPKASSTLKPPLSASSPAPQLTDAIMYWSLVTGTTRSTTW